MKDPKKDSFTLISGFYWKEVFKPSFILRLQSRITKIFGVGDRKKKCDKTKFKLIIVPDEKPKSIEQTESIPSSTKTNEIDWYLDEDGEIRCSYCDEKSYIQDQSLRRECYCSICGNKMSDKILSEKL